MRFSHPRELACDQTHATSTDSPLSHRRRRSLKSAQGYSDEVLKVRFLKPM